jgi:GTP-binding protein
MLDEEVDELCQKIVDELGWEGQVFKISAFQKLNTDGLCSEVMKFIETLPSIEEEQEEIKNTEFVWDTSRKGPSQEHDEFEDDDWDDDDDFDDEDDDFEVIYKK